MTLPNKLTLMRIALVPLMVVIAFVPFFSNHFIGTISLANFINVIIFVAASLTDFLDGYLARKNNQVTTFGKFADPIADKLLVVSALIILMVQFSGDIWWYLPAWSVIIIIAREFIVSGIRLVMAQRNVVVHASWFGKVKTFTTMVAITILFLYQIPIFNIPLFGIVGAIMMYVALLFTILSGVEYFMKSKEILLESV